MKSRIDSFISHGEEDAEIADQYLDKRKAIKQQRSGTKVSIGTVFYPIYDFWYPNIYHLIDVSTHI